MKIRYLTLLLFLATVACGQGQGTQAPVELKHFPLDSMEGVRAAGQHHGGGRLQRGRSCDYPNAPVYYPPRTPPCGTEARSCGTGWRVGLGPRYRSALIEHTRAAFVLLAPVAAGFVGR